MGAFADLLDEINSRPREGTLTVRVGDLPFKLSSLEEMVEYATTLPAPTFGTRAAQATRTQGGSDAP